MSWILWDFEGTLAFREGQWIGALRNAIAEKNPGLPIDLTAARDCLAGGFPWHKPHEEHYHLNDPDTWWRALEPLFARAASAAGASVSDALEIARRVRTHYADPSSWLPAEHAIETVKDLRARGWRQAIVSNHIPEIGSIAREVGIDVDRIFSSALLGVEKPNRAFLGHVIAELHEARCAWLIGDSATKDVAAAEEAGLPSILVGSSDSRATHCIPNLRSVVSIVGNPKRPTIKDH